MARKKKEESSGGGSAAWMSTFSDLMNLLLCFFVVLFAFSSVDEDKFAQVAASFNLKTFSIFSSTSGGEGVGEGELISQGVSQLESLSDHYDQDGFKSGQESLNGNADSSADKAGEGEGQLDATAREDKIIETYVEEIEKEQREKTEKIYEAVSDATEQKGVEDTVEINMDSNYQYVRILLSGAVLFDSGQADIKKEAYPIMNKIGDILKRYDKYMIKIEGHTDNVPISNSKYESNMWLSTARATRVFEYLTKEKGLNPDTLEASGRGEFEPVADNTTTEGRARNRRVEIKIYTNERYAGAEVGAD